MSHEILVIVAVYVAYFVLHSVLASLRMKRHIASRLPSVMPYYRLLFNLIAVLLAIPLVYLAWRYPGEPLWQWQGSARYVTNGIAVLAAIALLYSLRLYDMREFTGLKQFQDNVHEIRDMEHLRISAFHRYVRHPWYFLILLILWTRDLTTNQFLINLLITAYLFIGSRLEERKLIAYHGQVYEEYRKQVAALFPLPWKILSRKDARSLQRKSSNIAD